MIASTSFCEQKEAKKRSVHWSVRPLPRTNAAGRLKVFWFFFSKKNTFLP
jgi:hypothetical protein